MESSIFQSPGRLVRIGSAERVLSAVAGGTLLGFTLAVPLKLRAPVLLGGIALLARGISGYSLLYRILNIYRSDSQLRDGIRVEQSITINRPVEEVYAFWRDLENLPSFMENLKMVSVRDGRSHWVVEAPLGATVEWDAVIDEDQPNRKLSWHSLSGSEIKNTGVVMFEPAPGNRGAAVRVHLEYQAPGGSLGAALAKALGEEPDLQVQEDLRRFKSLLETGEIITISGQPTGRR